MFRLIRELFRGESLLDQSFEETISILDVAKAMMSAASQSLRKSDAGGVDMDVHKADIQINKYQREVRRNILTHLSVSQATDLTAALVLTSIIIDVERLGDYTKNIVELADAHPRRLEAGVYEERLRRLEERICAGYDDVRNALDASDADAARAYMSSHHEYAVLADQIIESLIGADDDLYKWSAVTVALYVRYLKRIEAHLNNIISSVVNPFPRLGYRSKRPSENDTSGAPPI
jgi:phosphate transport system protein